MSSILLGKSRGQLPKPPERMKQLGQSRNNTQLWMCLVVKVKSDGVKELIGTWNVRPMNQGKLDLVKGFPGGSEGKESAYNAGDLSSIPGLGRSPGEESGKPLQYSCLEKSHGERSLVGYSILAWKIPWMEEEPGGLQFIGFKESDMALLSDFTFK